MPRAKKAAKTKKAADDTILPPEEHDPALKRQETITTVDPITGKIAGQMSTKPTDLGEYKGSYKHKLYKEPFGLKVVEDETHGRTHHLKNVDHFWSGTEDEFKAQFEKS